MQAGAHLVLNVDDDECDAEPIVGHGPEPVLLAPARCLLEPRRIVDTPDLGDALWVPVRRQRKGLGHGSSVGT